VKPSQPEIPPQEDLLQIESDHEKHWQGMPEFIQGKKAPYAIISVRFASEEALQDFGRLIGQKVTNKTKTIWHPTFARGVAKPVWKDAK